MWDHAWSCVNVSGGKKKGGGRKKKKKSYLKNPTLQTVELNLADS